MQCNVRVHFILGSRCGPHEIDVRVKHPSSSSKLACLWQFLETRVGLALNLEQLCGSTGTDWTASPTTMQLSGYQPGLLQPRGVLSSPLVFNLIVRPVARVTDLIAQTNFPAQQVQHTISQNDGPVQLVITTNQYTITSV